MLTGGFTISIFEEPDTALLVLGALLIYVACTGVVGACSSSKRVLLGYHLLVLGLLTALIYAATMMYLYREQAEAMVHVYWNRVSETLSTDDRLSSYSEEQTVHAARRMLGTAGALIVTSGALLLVALWASSMIMGWKYTLKRIGSSANFVGFVCGEPSSAQALRSDSRQWCEDMAVRAIAELKDER
eukprot:gene18183-21661_t